MGADRFRPLLEPIIKRMIEMQQRVSDVDPQKSYIISSWQRLALIYGDELGKWLPELVPGLFKIIAAVLKDEVQLDFEDDTKINTYETDEAELAIFMLNIFVEKLSTTFRPYVPQTCEILFPIIKNHTNDVVRNAAFSCLPLLLQMVQHDRVLAVQLVREFLNLLVEVAEKEEDSTVLANLMESLKNCIDSLQTPFLSEAEINLFSEKMLKLLFVSDKRKQEKQKEKEVTRQEDEEFEEEEIEQIEAEEEAEEELQVNIANVLGILFKTHREQTVELANYVLSEIVSKTLKPGLSESAHRLAIYILVDMVEFLSPYFQDKWDDFFSVLINFSAHPTNSIRQAAAYGLGVFAQQTKGELFPKYSGEMNLSLMKSYEVPIGREKEKDYMKCRDNAIASIGKALKTHQEKVSSFEEVLAYWFQHLPLHADKIEAKAQNEFLSEIIEASPDRLIPSFDHLKHLLQVFADIVSKDKLCSREARQRIKVFLQ